MKKTNIKKAVIIDDNPDQALTSEVLIQEAGFTPIVLEGPLRSVDIAVDAVVKNGDWALCDHRLQLQKMAPFYGAELVAKLYDKHVPAILISQYTNIDIGVSIRRWRHKIPAVFTHREFETDLVRDALEQCLDEFAGKPHPRRRPYRTLVRVVQRTQDSGEDVIDVMVPGWRVDEAVRLPVSLIPETIRRKAQPGQRFFAQVNTGAEVSEELFFKDFQLAEDPDERDGIA